MDSKQIVRGHVMLRSATPENPAPIKVRELATQHLQEHGLVVKRSSPLAITVEGLPETFERAFQAKLDQNQGTVYWNGKPTIPDKLSDLVADVVFPQPVKLG